MTVSVLDCRQLYNTGIAWLNHIHTAVTAPVSLSLLMLHDVYKINKSQKYEYNFLVDYKCTGSYVYTYILAQECDHHIL